MTNWRNRGMTPRPPDPSPGTPIWTIYGERRPDIGPAECYFDLRCDCDPDGQWCGYFLLRDTQEVTEDTDCEPVLADYCWWRLARCARKESR